ncbi:PRC-barrel domain-containing protein [Rhodococcus sp. DMU1]|uniref:PRC-barrel domain-containing protein n=1 Tax=Rhodococcus sp. DMU1 TaxID=2722825 RepID=UPI00143EBC1C|nr:PRC-barrel domain-containing protein [Rhodococcus sp. DMU1]QIX53957.1 PRC-barrel domain containing protein [Rhodococcus sp. DMU1]
MRFSAAVGRQVVGSDAAETVGQVAGFVVDPAVRRVVAVQVKGPGAGTIVPWANIGAFGDDAVVVGGPDAVGEPDAAIAALTGKDHTLVGKRVLTTAGNEWGTVADVDFDPGSGAVTALLGKGGEVAGVRLVGVGSYAVVVDTH